MLDPGDREFLDAHAPDDVRATVQWLLGRGYRLTGRQGGGTFGAALTFTGSEKGRPVTVRVVVDRSQWMLDVNTPPDGRLESLDVLLEAHDPAGEPRAQFIALTDSTATGRPPKQLPVGVVWRESLPVILDWLQSGDDAAAAVAEAYRRRVELGRRDSRRTARRGGYAAVTALRDEAIDKVRPMGMRTRMTEAGYVADLVTADGRVAVSAYGTGPDELLAILAAEQRYLTEQTGHSSVSGSTYLAKARERIRRGPGAGQPPEGGR